MAAAKRIIPIGLIVALTACLAGGWGEPGRQSTARVQESLDHLHAGRLVRAEAAALMLASLQEPPQPRAWLIVAAARQRRGRFSTAIEAYENFLVSCTSTELRRFTAEQIRGCRGRLSRPPMPIAPSKRLNVGELEEMSEVGKQVRTGSSEHFVVRTRNARLTRVIVAEAERALQHICGDILAGQAYPHTVEIHIWPDHEQYTANKARKAPEWSGGSFTLSSRDGIMTRRIDLTQLNADGRFDTIMLDRVLPHEMCHLVIQEFFGDASCPLMLNEGLAMLAESGGMDNSRIMLAGTVLAARAKTSLVKLLACRRHDVGDPAVFYAHAFSFAEFLRSRMTRRQFGRLLGHVKDGCDVGDAIQRALYAPLDGDFMAELTGAWADRTIRQAQYLRTLKDASVDARSTIELTSLP